LDFDNLFKKKNLHMLANVGIFPQNFRIFYKKSVTLLFDSLRKMPPI
jgi:hypothetical protein